MARRGGPIPEPIGLKILKGRGNGKDVAGRPIPRVPPFERCEPDAPSWLTGAARAEWNRVVPALAALDLLKEVDGAVLAAYCSAWAEVVETTEILAREGYVATNPQSGHVSAHPLVAVRAAARRDLRVLAKEFGLTPSSEVDLGWPPSVPENDADDPFAASSGGYGT